MGKGEIARLEQFLLFPQCFKSLVFQGRQQVSLCGNGLSKLLDEKYLMDRLSGDDLLSTMFPGKALSPLFPENNLYICRPVHKTEVIKIREIR